MSISQRCINSDTRVILSEVLVIMHIDHDHDLFEFNVSVNIYQVFGRYQADTDA